VAVFVSFLGASLDEDGFRKHVLKPGLWREVRTHDPWLASGSMSQDVSAVCFYCLITTSEMTGHRDGDFEGFYRATSDDLLRALIVALRNRPLAEDSLAEAYARALSRWEEVSLHPNRPAWVMKVALNCARAEQRKAVRRSTDILPEVPVPDDPPTDPGLVRRLLALPERQREVVGLRVVLGLDTRQTAEVLGIAEGTVTVHLHRALNRLERELSAIAPQEAWR
jgi:RNA polymerase sigma-70 factor (ECF subfamily)